MAQVLYHLSCCKMPFDTHCLVLHTNGHSMVPCPTRSRLQLQSTSSHYRQRLTRQKRSRPRPWIALANWCKGHMMAMAHLQPEWRLLITWVLTVLRRMHTQPAAWPRAHSAPEGSYEGRLSCAGLRQVQAGPGVTPRLAPLKWEQQGRACLASDSAASGQRHMWVGGFG